MMRWQLLVAVVLFSLCLCQPSVDAATVSVSIHNAPSVNVPVHLADGEWRIGTGPGDEQFFLQTAEGSVLMFGALDPDPMITFASSVVDIGAPSPFSFSYVLPLSPVINNPSIVSDSFGGSVAGSSVTVTALAPPAGIPVDADGITEVQVFTLSDDGGSTWKNVGLDLMPTTSVPGAGGSVGAFNEGPISTIAGGPWTHMRADINFRLTGGGDVFSFNGAKVLVPEPGMLGLLWMVVAAYGVGWRRAVR